MSTVHNAVVGIDNESCEYLTSRGKSVRCQGEVHHSYVTVPYTGRDIGVKQSLFVELVQVVSDREA